MSISTFHNVFLAVFYLSSRIIYREINVNFVVPLFSFEFIFKSACRRKTVLQAAIRQSANSTLDVAFSWPVPPDLSESKLSRNCSIHVRTLLVSLFWCGRTSIRQQLNACNTCLQLKFVWLKLTDFWHCNLGKLFPIFYALYFGWME